MVKFPAKLATLRTFVLATCAKRYLALHMFLQILLSYPAPDVVSHNWPVEEAFPVIVKSPFHDDGKLGERDAAAN